VNLVAEEVAGENRVDFKSAYHPDFFRYNLYSDDESLLIGLHGLSIRGSAVSAHTTEELQTVVSPALLNTKSIESLKYALSSVKFILSHPYLQIPMSIIN
jgi:hypothetical protein